MTTQPLTTTDEESDGKQHNEGICNVVEAVEESEANWKLIVLNDLRDSEKRFNKLKRSTGASSYTLSRVLDGLARK